MTTNQLISPNLTSLPAPQTKADWAYAILIALGIDPTKNPNSVASLIAQQNAEGTTGALWNNPLATTTQEFNSTPQNSAGVQKFATWQQGASANASFMLVNDPGLVTVLSKNPTVAQYGAALQNADWEGLGGNTYGPNVSYGKAVAGDASSGGGLSAAYAKLAPNLVQKFNAAGVAPVDAKGNPQPDAGQAVPQGATLPGILSFLGIPSINWTAVGGMAIAIAFILAGIYIMFHTQINSQVKKGVAAAAA